MSFDPAFVRVAHRFKLKRVRPDGASDGTVATPKVIGARLIMIGLSLFFVILGAINLDLNPAEARLGLAAGEKLGPLGQVYGYWAPDLWPVQVVPSLILGRLEAFGRPSSAAVRWPAALAGIIAGWMIARSMAKALGLHTGVLFGICWFGSLALIDRSAATGLDLIVGLATLASVDRLVTRGSDRRAGLWAALAFLAGGWPSLVVIGLAIIVIGRTTARFSPGLLLPPLAAAILWSFWTVWASSAEVWAASLTLPLTQKPAWMLGPQVVALGLPWSPFAILLLSRSVRDGWRSDGRSWLIGWLQVALACVIVGTLVPGLSQVTRVPALAGLLLGSAACLESARSRVLAPSPRRAFFIVFGCVLGLWLAVMLYGSYIWNLAMPYYRPLGIIMSIVAIGVAILGWSALETGNSRRGLVTLMVIAVGLKLVHWGYYVPEWNYRYSQGPWGRAIGQWVPKRWPVYTFHDWPPDLAFFTKRPVRQLRSPHYLEYQTGPRSKFLLLQASEFENWPQSAPPITLVAKLLDQSAGERVLARTAGPLPPPLGPNPSARRSIAQGTKRLAAGKSQTRR
jgi:hypothetical protein